MIPKTIHCCWFGHTEKTRLAQKCIKSWGKICPDYTIIEWNEKNIDLESYPLYVRQAYEAKKWAFVTDYVRLKVVYENGGLYFDTDVELLRKPDKLLENTAFFGFEDGKHIATGLGFGAEKGANILLALMEDYESIPFILPDGSFDTKSCPIRNTEVFIKHGLVQDNSMQILDGQYLILPSEYLAPLNYFSGKKKITKNTISIHWFAASWLNKEQIKKHKSTIKDKKKIDRTKRIDYLVHTPNRLLIRLIGSKRYEKLKQSLKR